MNASDIGGIYIQSSYIEQIISIVEQLPEDKVLEVLTVAESIKMRVDFLQNLINKGVQLEELFGQEQALKENWVSTFTGHLGEDIKAKIYFDQFFWHAFSYKKINCLENEAAAQAFNETDKKTCYIFYQNWGLQYKLENASEIIAADFDNEQDVYIVDEDFTWTYIHTHESPLCGPYYYNFS